MALHTRFSAAVFCVFGAATAASRHVFLPFSYHSDVPGPELTARTSSEHTGLSAVAGYAWAVNVTVGTPGQPLSLLVSPSVGDTWVPDAETSECSPDWYYRNYYGYSGDYDIPSPQCHWGSYNYSQSQTYLPANQRSSGFEAYYVDGVSVYGRNMTDKLVVGGVEVDDFPMGLVDSADRWIGILGLGFNRSTTSANVYPNFMDRIVSSGKIETPAYSMWLDNAEGTSGGLLFGAIDQSRFTGDLLRLQTSSRYSYRTSFGAVLSRINGTTGSGDAMPPIRSNDFPVDVTIGPAEVFSFLPSLLAEGIAAMAGAVYNETLGYMLIPCDAGTTNSANFVFELGGSGGPLLSVQTADLVIPPRAVSAYSTSAWLNGTDICFFGIQKRSTSSSYSDYSYYNLGNSILRRTYLVFDLANDEIALAPAKFSSGSGSPSPTIVAFESYGATVPAAAAFTGNTDNPRSGPNYGSSSSSEEDRTRWQSVAIGVGVGFGILTLISTVAAVIIWRRLYRGGKNDAAEKGGDKEGVAPTQPSEPVPSPADAQGAGEEVTSPSAASPLGTLPAIQEGAEPNQAAAQPAAPAAHLSRPIMPTEVASPLDRGSVTVPLPSRDQQPQERSAPGEVSAPPRSPKGKGKEVDRAADET